MVAKNIVSLGLWPAHPTYQFKQKMKINLHDNFYVPKNGLSITTR